MFTNNAPSINMTMVGFGQAGTRMVDKFASLKNKDGKPVYNCLALNSNDGDLKELKFVPIENQVSLKLGGLGKNPEKAIRILESDDKVREMLKQFITHRLRPTDDLVLFFAGLGGGTGTSTLVKSIEEFFDYTNKPKITEELKKIQASTTAEDFRTNLDKYKVQAVRRAQDRFIKIGVICTLPVRSDGPDVLRQVNDFATRIWNSAKNPAKGIAFVIFADNQHFYDEWTQLGSANSGADNYRDYANKQIMNVIHEINTGTNGGGTSVTFDPQDFRRIILEHNGCLVIGKQTKDIKEITNSHDIKSMFLDAIRSSSLHNPIALEEEDSEGNVTYSKVHHVGLLAVIDKANQIGSSFLDEAKNEITNILPLSGTVFSGYLQDKADYKATVYTLFKTLALPSRLSKGLVKEYEEFRNKQQQVTYKSDTIEQIAAAADDDFEIDLNLEDLGIHIEPEAKTNENEEIDVENMDLSDIDLSTL